MNVFRELWSDIQLWWQVAVQAGGHYITHTLRRGWETKPSHMNMQTTQSSSHTAHTHTMRVYTCLCVCNINCFLTSWRLCCCRRQKLDLLSHVLTPDEPLCGLVACFSFCQLQKKTNWWTQLLTISASLFWDLTEAVPLLFKGISTAGTLPGEREQEPVGLAELHVALFRTRFCKHLHGFPATLTIDNRSIVICLIKLCLSTDLSTTDYMNYKWSPAEPAATMTLR